MDSFCSDPLQSGKSLVCSLIDRGAGVSTGPVLVAQGWWPEALLDVWSPVMSRGQNSPLGGCPLSQ